MSKNQKKYTLSDLIDVKLLQNLQESFAKMMGVASITVDEVGPVTSPSNFTDFCIKYTRSTEEGFKRCNKCDIDAGKRALETGKPVIYTCHAGLTDFAIPIVVEGSQVGTILGGQILTAKPDEEHFRKIAREIGINEEEYINAVRKIEIVPYEKVEAAANFLSVVANAISQLANNNLKLIEANDRAKLIGVVAETIRSSLDLDEVFQLICSELAGVFNVQRTFIVQFMHYNGTTEFKVRKEFVSKPEIRGLEDIKFDVRTVNYWGDKLLKEGEKIIVDNIPEADVPDYFKETYGSIGEKSTVGIAVKKGDDAWGWVGISEYDYYRHWKEEEISLLETISNQIYIAIKQAELHSTIKKQVKQEALLKEIISILNSSFDLDQTKQRFVTQVGLSLNADRAFFADYNPITQRYSVSESAEYLSSQDLKSSVGFDFTSVPGFIENIMTFHLQGLDVIYEDVEEYAKGKDSTMQQLAEFFRKNGFSALFAINITYGDNFLGNLVVSYKEKRKISQEDIIFIKTLANQAGFAIQQAKTYEELKQITRNQNAILNNMPFMAWLKDANGRLLSVNEIFAKMCNSSIENVLGKTDFDVFPPEDAQNYRNIDIKVMESKASISLEDLIVGPEGPRWHETFKSPIFDESGGVVGTTGLSRDITERKEFEEELIRRQELIVKANRRESLLRQISETMRSSLDLNVIKSKIVEEAGKSLNADSCFIVSYDEDRDSFTVDEYSEYRSSLAEKSFVGINSEDRKVGFFVNAFRNNLGVRFSNVEKFIEENNLKGSFEEAFLKEHNVKSAYIYPMLYVNRKLGNIVLTYTNTYRELDNSELEFLNIIATQSAIALYQASLYSNTKELAKRETLLREIIELIRGSLDIKYVRHQMVRQIGLFIGADRVAFADFDFDKGNYFISEGNEYRSSDNVKTFVGYDFAGTPGFIDAIRELHLSGRDIIFSDLDEYLQKNNMHGSAIEKYYREMGFMSSMAINIYHADSFYGNLVVTFEKKRQINENDIKMLKTLADQSGIAIYQSNLYEKEKRTAQRELLLRKSIETIRRFIDVDDVLTTICDEVAKLFNVQRATIVEFADRNDFTKWNIRREYKVREDIIGLTDTPYDVRAGVYNGQVTVVERRNIVIDNIDESDTPDYYKEAYKNMGVKSILAVPIKGEEDIFGLIFLSSVDKYRSWTKEEVQLLEDVASQVNVAIKQADLYDKQKKTAERETLLRLITEKMRSSLDIEETLQFICEETAKLFNVQRAAIAQFPNKEDFREYVVRKEYLSSPDITGFPNTEDSGPSAAYWANGIIANDIVLALDNISESDVPDYFKRTYGSMGVKSIMGTGIKKGEDVIGTLILSEYKTVRTWTEEEQNLLVTIADQVYIALNQATLFEKERKTAQREKLLKDVVVAIRSSLDINEVKKNVVTQLCNVFKADRCYFRNYDRVEGKFLPPDNEYITSEDTRAISQDVPDQEGLAYFFEILKTRGKSFYPVVMDEETVKGTPVERYFKSVGIKADYAMPIIDRDEELNYLVLHYVHRNPKLDEDDKKLLETISEQIVIALEHAKLFKTVQLNAERSKLIGSILSKVISSFDINEIKEIVKDIGVITKADRCYFVEVDLEKMGGKAIKSNAEYLSSPEIKSAVGYEFDPDEVKLFVQQYLEKKDLIIFDYEKVLDEANPLYDGLKKYIRRFELKSGIGIPFIYMDKLVAVLAIEYTEKKIFPSSDEIEFLKILGNQVGMVYKQIMLYQETKKMAEIEKFNRSILEILRTTLDKKTIKHLFVKNIGKYFNADRVFFAEYDHYSHVFLPVEHGAEYLSNSKEMSFVGYDLSNPLISEYTQQLANKREVIIECADKYKAESHLRNQAYIEFFEKADVKSSYIFPVMYQERVMGFFRIGYTQNTCRDFSVEDVNRIRNICSQAGISLYQAELFEKYQESAQIKKDFISNISREFKQPLDNIIEYTDALVSSDLDRHKQMEYLNNINENSRYLSQLRNDIINISEIESDNYKLNIQTVDTSQVIMDVVNDLQTNIWHKNVTVNTSLEKINVVADKDRFYQIMYDLLSNAVNYVPTGSYLFIKSWLDNYKLGVSIEISGLDMAVDVQNRIFEIFKHVDLSYVGGRKDLGLGLFLVKRLIELHEGVLRVDSTENNGTKITIMLNNATLKD